VTNVGLGAVVDASVAVKWRLNDEELLDEARLLLDRYVARDIKLVAPSLIRYEVANTFEQARRAGRLTDSDVAESLRYFLDLGVHAQQDSDELIAMASDLARRLGLSAYDAIYVALAKDLGMPLVSNDQGLLRHLADYSVAACALKDVRSLL